MSCPVLLGPPDYELLGPVHVFGGEPVTAARELGADVQSRPGRPVGGRLGALGIGGVETRPVLVAAGDARLQVTAGQEVRSEVC